MEKGYEPVECDRTRDAFDHFALRCCGIFHELIAYEVCKKQLIGPRAGQVMIEVELGRKDVVYDAYEASVRVHWPVGFKGNCESVARAQSGAKRGCAS